MFEVVARVGNFTRAAEELNVTQSAVSRQISILESYLKVELFRRERLGVSLTAAGEEYWQKIGPAFAMISAATARLCHSGRVRPLTLRVYPTFAVKWLIPRLPSFNRQYPGVEVRVKTGTASVDFAREDIDIAIQLIPDADAPPNSRRLLPDSFQPVCSASLFKERPPPETIDELFSHKLLHSRYRRDDWRDWLAAKKRPDLQAKIAEGVEFPSSVLTYQAAAEGLGIAIGQPRLLDREIASGSLIPLFPPAVDREFAYYAIWPNRKDLDLKGRQLLSWLVRQVQDEDVSTMPGPRLEAAPGRSSRSHPH